VSTPEAEGLAQERARASAAATLAAAGAGTVAATRAAATPVQSGRATVEMGAAGVATLTTEIIEAVARFARSRTQSIVPLLYSSLQESFAHRTPAELNPLVAREVAYEAEFLRRQRARILRDLPRALRGTPEEMKEAVSKLMAREARYIRQREHAMAARAHSAAGMLDLREQSPEGALWMLSDSVVNHTPGCVAMSRRFWPWKVLQEVMHPPVHAGCPCYLVTFQEAVARGLMRADQVPDVADAYARALQARALEEALIESYGEDQLAEGWITLVESPGWDPDDHKRWAKGTPHGGEFKGEGGGLFAGLKKLVPGKPKHPAEMKGRGRKAWIKGNRVFIPEDRHFKRKIGGQTYESPAGGTNLYRNGALISQAGVPDTHPDLAPGQEPASVAPGAKLETPPAIVDVTQATHAAMHERVARSLADPQKAHPPVVKGWSAAASHETLQHHGYAPTMSQSGANGDTLHVAYQHPAGHRLAVAYNRKTGRVAGTEWDPKAQKGESTPPLFGGPGGQASALKGAQGVPGPSGAAPAQKPAAPKPPPQPVVHEPTVAHPIEAGAIPDYSHVRLTEKKRAGGSQGAQIAEADDGEKWLLKTYGGKQDRVATELLANAVYREMGAKVAPAGTREVGGKMALAYPLLPGELRKPWEPNAKLGEHYMTDALVGNWDFIGLEHDNVLWDGDEPARLDQGGTFEYRAMGSPKPFGPVPTEVWTMLSPKGQGFGTVDVSEPQMRQQAHAIAQTLTPEVIDGLIDAAPFTDAEMEKRIRANLKARVAWMGRFAAGQEHLPTPAAGAAAEQALRGGQKGTRLYPEQEAALTLTPACTRR
jgi:hypothetical protein